MRAVPHILATWWYAVVVCQMCVLNVFRAIVKKCIGREKALTTKVQVLACDREHET